MPSCARRAAMWSGVRSDLSERFASACAAHSTCQPQLLRPRSAWQQSDPHDCPVLHFYLPD